MKIYLARHGQDEDNAKDILNGHRDKPLTELGREQAHLVTSKILRAKLKFDKVLCSPLIRAKETAEIITKDTDNPDPEIEPLLIERDFGVMTGLHKSKINEICYPNIIRTETIVYFLNPEGAETFPGLIDRSNKMLNKIEAECSKCENILLVSHGDIGKMIYAAFYDLPWEKVLAQFHFGNSELLLLSKDTSYKEAHLFKVQQHNS